MFRDGEVIINIVLVFAVFGAIIFFGIKGCDDKPKVTETETRELRAGTPDTVTIRTVDTVWKETKTREIIRITEEKIVRYGKDSSRFDTTISNDGSQIRVAGITFPAIDSIRLDVASLIKFPEITKTDTIKITRVDTLQITKIIEAASDVPWFDRFWMGALTSSAVVVGLVYVLGGIK